ncbi:hypothetical protein RND81_10G024700 [Saponaria officinalis]|uniref:Strictosidine synthase conserved region domain-containing protein n=1 Tax=Saponaria officinalis TaxID=3572 RepID=A0AAW1I005_SAPOF
MGKSKCMMSIVLLISLILFNGVISVAGKQRNFTQINLGPNQRGPETIAFDCKGEGPYAGISDGRILKWQGQQTGWTEYAVTTANRPSTCDGVYDIPREKECGRPLGLKFDPKTCELYIADSSIGLLRVGPNGGVATPLATSYNGVPFTFLNSLDVDFDSKVIYFTESSANYHRWEAGVAMEKGDQSGRVMKYDINTKKVTVLLEHLSIANGIALSKNKDFLLVSETIRRHVVRFWLNDPKKGISEVFLEQHGMPDNIHSDSNGDFWIALLEANSIKVNELGEVLDTLEDGEVAANPSDFQEFRNTIWVSYVDKTFAYYAPN